MREREREKERDSRRERTLEVQGRSRTRAKKGDTPARGCSARESRLHCARACSRLKYSDYAREKERERGRERGKERKATDGWIGKNLCIERDRSRKRDERISLRGSLSYKCASRWSRILSLSLSPPISRKQLFLVVRLCGI